MKMRQPTITYHRCTKCDGRREIRWLRWFWRMCDRCDGYGILKRWNAVLDDRTRDCHSMRDGMLFQISDEYCEEWFGVGDI